MTPKMRGRCRGFSLLELVVAVAILALALSIFYRALGGGIKAVADTSRHERALAIAESVLQSRGMVPSSGWHESGSWDAYRWSVQSVVFHEAGSAPPTLHRVRVDVFWMDTLGERGVSLVTLLPEQS